MQSVYGVWCVAAKAVISLVWSVLSMGRAQALDDEKRWAQLWAVPGLSPSPRQNQVSVVMALAEMHLVQICTSAACW